MAHIGRKFVTHLPQSPSTRITGMFQHYQHHHFISSLYLYFFLFFFPETGAHCVILAELEPAKELFVCLPGCKIKVMCHLTQPSVETRHYLNQKIIYQCLVLNMKYFGNTLADLFRSYFPFYVCKR